MIKRAREESLFEENWLNKLDGAHDSVHSIANDLFKKYQQGEVAIARSGLKELHTAVKQMFSYFE